MANPPRPPIKDRFKTQSNPPAPSSSLTNNYNMKSGATPPSTQTIKDLRKAKTTTAPAPAPKPPGGNENNIKLAKEKALQEARKQAKNRQLANDMEKSLQRKKGMAKKDFKKTISPQ